jgi:ketosteroid isomerase-like protein
MSEENLELTRRWVEAVNAKDLDAFLALMDEEVECVSRIVSMEGPLRGHAGARQWWESWFTAFPDYEIQMLELEDHEPVVVGSFRAVGHGAESALPLEDVAWNVSEWRDGKCVWWQVFTDREEAVATASARGERAPRGRD